MIADGLLEPYDKQSPRSPEQKYRAIAREVSDKAGKWVIIGQSYE